jgi:pyrroloquinoline quinone biosynthesis protein D
VSGKGKRGARVIVRLAPGIRLDGGQGNDGLVVLACPEGKVQLNRMAAAILRLCDGSRARDDIVAEALRGSQDLTRTAQIVEFMDAAVARGWIDES